MKRKDFFKRVLVCVLLSTLLVILCACTESQLDLPTENTLPTSDVTTTPDLSPPSSSVEPSAPTPSSDVEPSSPAPSTRALTDAELARLNEVFGASSPYPVLVSFLTCTYSTPEEVDLNAVFYNGLGGFIKPTDEQKDWLAANGYDVYVDWRDNGPPSGPDSWVFLSPETMNAKLQQYMGISLNQVQKPFLLDDVANGLGAWEWVDAYGVYLARRTDSNGIWVKFSSGSYMGNDTYVAEYTDGWWAGADVYRVTYRLKNDAFSTIQFISNVKIN